MSRFNPKIQIIMDLQDILDNAMAANREEQMKTSNQLTIGELILKLESVDTLEKAVFFDDTDIRPTDVGSWRGSYREFALRYSDEDEFDGFTGEKLLETLEDAIGSSFTGYKGGEFKMGKVTPVWVANYGDSSGFSSRYQGVVNVSETEERIVIETAEVDY